MTTHGEHHQQAEAIFSRCREFIREQTQGEWSDQRIEMAALRLGVFVADEIAAALKSAFPTSEPA